MAIQSKQPTVILVEKDGFRAQGADLHPTRFTLSFNHFQYRKYINRGGQQNRIICGRQRSNPEAPKSDTQLHLEILSIKIKDRQRLWAALAKSNTQKENV